MSTIARGVCVIAFVDDKVWLATRINPDKVFFGLLSSPGGKVDGSERLIETCVREMKEETGLTIDHARFFWFRKDYRQYPNGDPYEVDTYLVRLEQHEKPSHMEPHIMSPWSDFPMHRIVRGSTLCMPGLQDTVTWMWETLKAGKDITP